MRVEVVAIVDAGVAAAASSALADQAAPTRIRRIDPQL